MKKAKDWTKRKAKDWTIDWDAKGDLFRGDDGRPHAYPGSRDTSKAAAASILPVTGNGRILVLNAIDLLPNGATIEEIVSYTGLKIQTVCARRKKLEEMGLVIDSGEKRKTSSGRNAIVWVMKPDTI